MPKNIHYFNNNKPRIPKKKKTEYDENNMARLDESLQNLPVHTLVKSIEVIIQALEKQGKQVRIWDHKDEVVKLVRTIGGEIYILAESENQQVEEYEDALRQARKDNAFLSSEIRKLRQENEKLKQEKYGRVQ